MALTDIMVPVGQTTTALFNRGNGGVLVDVQARDENMLYLPVIIPGGGGGNIFIMSE